MHHFFVIFPKIRVADYKRAGTCNSKIQGFDIMCPFQFWLDNHLWFHFNTEALGLNVT